MCQPAILRPSSRRSLDAQHRRPPRPIGWGTAAAIALLVVGASAWAVERTGRSESLGAETQAAAAEVPPGETPTQADRWKQVLGRLDDARARAWRVGEPALLREVYVPRTAVLRRDREMLWAYVDRGTEVLGVHLEFDLVQLVRRRASEAVLRVVDRLGPAAVRTSTGRMRPLPTDQPTGHQIVLSRSAHGWRIADVRLRPP